MGAATTTEDPIDATSIKLPGAASDEHPVVTTDGQELFFDRDGAGNTEIFVAIKNSTGFGAQARLLAVPGGDVKPAWICPDACTLYYFDESSGGAKLFKMTRK